MNIYWITKLSDKNPFRSTQLGASEGLRKRGHKVTLFFIRNFNDKKSNTDEINYIPIIDKPLFSGLVFGLILFFYFPFLSKKNKVDMVIIDGDQIFSPFIIMMKLMHIPIVWDIRSLPIDCDKSLLHDISFYLTNYLANALTTITPELKNFLQKTYNLYDKKIGLWPSGVSMQTFSVDNAPLKSPNTVKKNKFTLIHHGTYSPTRGIEELIQSIKQIPNSIRNDIQLLLVGIPKEKIQDLYALAKQLNVEKQITIILPVKLKEIPAYIQSADVGVIPLPPENKWWKVSVPLKTLEYLAMAKPIIVTDIPFHRKIIQECKCGRIAQTGNPEDIAKEITYLYEHQNELAIMGEKGQRLIENKYTWENIACYLETFINEILEHK
jgi:glycosyltransferase involved in cell wall biosynthesis